MTILIDQINGIVQVSFKRGEYAVFSFENEQRCIGMEPFAICPLIDRSYKGKDPDIGSPALFLTAEEADKVRMAL